MGALLGLAAMALAPFALALVLAGLQAAVYRVLVRLGRLEAERVPFFGILLLRGLVAALLLAGGTAVVVHLLGMR
jgi:hypothetical protein